VPSNICDAQCGERDPNQPRAEFELSQERPARNPPADGARCDSRRGVVSDPLVLPGVAPSHDIELVVFFSEPHRSPHHGAGFSKGTHTDVLLATNLGRDGHAAIL
jgi:hypothetical protein